MMEVTEMELMIGLVGLFAMYAIGAKVLFKQVQKEDAKMNAAIRGK